MDFLTRVDDVALLAHLGLYLVSEKDHDQIYARLHGNTLPFDDMLNCVGARWDRVAQTWNFLNRDSLVRFVDVLAEEVQPSKGGLSEASVAYIGQPGPQTPLYKLLNHGPNAIVNHELLELVLSFDSYLSDPASISRELMDEFGSLGAVLGCEPGRLSAFNDVTPRIVGLIKAIQLTIERVLHEPIQNNPILGSWQALLDYLRIRLKHRQREELIVLYLDRKNQLIKADSSQGTIDHAPLYPRDIAARALELFAGSVILAHNHPSGDPTASSGDIEMTKKTMKALESLDIVLHDHVIVGRASHTSFRSEGLI